MYVSKPPDKTWFLCGVYEYDRPPRGGHRHRREGTRHFVGAPDGRLEEVDDADHARGMIPRLEVEQLS